MHVSLEMEDFRGATPNISLFIASDVIGGSENDRFSILTMT